MNNRKEANKVTNLRSPARSNSLTTTARWLKILSIIPTVLFSLMTFPSGLPIMIGFWATLYFALTFRNSSTIAPILILFAVLCIKLPSFSLIMISVYVAVAFTITIHVVANRWIHYSASIQKSNAIFLLAVCTLFSFTYYSQATQTHKSKFIPDRPVVCLGDSLTAWGYPKLLAKRINVPVSDFGASGIDTREAIERIDSILAMNPQAVVLEIGGHDFNKGFSRQPTEDNLRILIESFQNAGIVLILVEIPRGFVTDPYYGIERQLAAQYDLQLVNDTTIRRFVLQGPMSPFAGLLGKATFLSNDGIHPNHNGNKLLASAVRDALKQVFGPGILK